MYEFISQNIMLVALFVTSGGMLLWPLVAKQIGGTKEIGTLETTRLMNGGSALVLDIRDNAEFNSGRIPKSKNIPLAEINKRIDEITKFKDKPVILTARGSTNVEIIASATALAAIRLPDALPARCDRPTSPSRATAIAATIAQSAAKLRPPTRLASHSSASAVSAIGNAITRRNQIIHVPGLGKRRRSAGT